MDAIKIPLFPMLVIAFSMGAAVAQLPEVNPPAEPKGEVTQRMDDETISSRVRDAISSDPELKDVQFTVETANAIVTLNGTATSRSQIARAVAVARAVPGVKSVVNILSVPA